MSEKTEVIDKKDIVIRFSGDSGDGMQLTGRSNSRMLLLYLETVYQRFRIILLKYAPRKVRLVVFPGSKYILGMIPLKLRVILQTCSWR